MSNEASKPEYGEKYIEWAETAAEVEVIIGIVSVSLILIYGGGIVAALGTAIGFALLEFFTLLATSLAWNVVQLRKETAALRASLVTAGVAAPEALAVPVEEDDDEEVRVKVLRIVGISAAVIIGIVITRQFLA